ncbi:MAG: DUF4394 domain-containing protein, partial [Planctomycetia bacterium]|nr:DUF4394 domain-containing protein [Planctomycetia bacterium]
TDSNSLVKFDSSSPNTIISTTLVTGLGTNTLQALDVLPGPVGNFLKGTLFGFATNATGTSGQVYAIVPSTGFATPIVASFTINPSTGYDIDLNPTSGKLRIVDSANDNIRFDITTGTVIIDTALIAGADIVGAAYDRNALYPSPLATPFTTLFDIDSTTDTLTRQGGVNGIPSPNSGIITTVGPLGVNTDSNSLVKFDSSSPNTIISTTLVTGLGTNTLQALDVLPGPVGNFLK